MNWLSLTLNVTFLNLHQVVYETYRDKEQFSKIQKQAEQTRTSKTSEVGSGAMEE